jgi:hypothetical protein
VVEVPEVPEVRLRHEVFEQFTGLFYRTVLAETVAVEMCALQIPEVVRAAVNASDDVIYCWIPVIPEVAFAVG